MWRSAVSLFMFNYESKNVFIRSILLKNKINFLNQYIKCLKYCIKLILKYVKTTKINNSVYSSYFNVLKLFVTIKNAKWQISVMGLFV